MSILVMSTPNYHEDGEHDVLHTPDPPLDTVFLDLTAEYKEDWYALLTWRHVFHMEKTTGIDLFLTETSTTPQTYHTPQEVFT